MIIITYPCKDFKEPWRNQLNDKPRQKSLQFRMVGLTGLEPVTPRLSSACSNQLSYKPYKMVELRRFELLTSCLQSRRSTN